ncbi:MAG TPA: response regulator [Thermoanaerobaculia bacterium]|nr:response regulator [Thermoanaerobaculia bacterium]
MRRAPVNLRKLLIIDGDAKLLASYRDLLTPYGFQVLTAPDGDKAITLIDENPDIMLLILDVIMPNMDGRQWLRWYREQRKDCPVIIISTYELCDTDVDLVPSAVLQKPFHVAELLDLVGLFCGLGTPAGSYSSI